MNFCTIKDVMDYRDMQVLGQGDFGLFTNIPEKFESEVLGSTYYCLGFITNGILDIAIDDVTYSMNNRSLLIYRPGQHFKVAQIAEGTKGAFILFTRKFLDTLSENIFSVRRESFLSQGVQSLITLNAKDFNTIKELFLKIFDLLQSIMTSDQELVAKNLASALVYETDTIVHNYINLVTIAKAKPKALVTRFLQKVKQYYQTSRRINFYAKKLNVTPNYLAATVKNVMGYGPGTIINQHVIGKAKQMLSMEAYTISEIAYELNFSDPFIFSKFFKKNVGMSPTEYRETCSCLF